MCRSNQAAACHLHVVEVPSLASLSGHRALSWVCVSTFCHCCGRLELPSAAVEMEPGLKTPLVSSLWEVRAQSGVLSPKRAGEVQSSQVQPCFWSPVSLEMLLADLQDGSSGLCTYARHAAVPPGNTWSSSPLYFQIHLKKKRQEQLSKGMLLWWNPCLYLPGSLQSQGREMVLLVGRMSLRGLRNFLAGTEAN